MEDLADPLTVSEASELEGRVNKYFLYETTAFCWGSCYLGQLLLLADAQARAMNRSIQVREACLSSVDNPVLSVVSTHQ